MSAPLPTNQELLAEILTVLKEIRDAKSEAPPPVRTPWSPVERPVFAGRFYPEPSK